VATPTRIYLARHGQTVTNREQRFCGHSETPLTPLGLEQARALARRISGFSLGACYTSDLGRAKETASIALGQHPISPRVDPRLRELHYGDWELQPEAEVQRRDPAGYRLLEDEDPAWRPPGGESVAEVRARTSSALARIAASHPGQGVLVISHGTAINCLISTILAMPETHVFRIDVSHCSLTEIEQRRGRMYIVRLNDTAHLEGLA